MPISSSSREFAIAAFLILAACGAGEENAGDSLFAAEAEARSGAAESGLVHCALADAADFAPDCRIEREETADGLVLTMRHADGGFRRLLVTRDGRGVVAADGAEEAEVSTVSPREIEVAIAGDRYRLPATVRGGAPTEP